MFDYVCYKLSIIRLRLKGPAFKQTITSVARQKIFEWYDFLILAY